MYFHLCYGGILSALKAVAFLRRVSRVAAGATVFTSPMEIIPTPKLRARGAKLSNIALETAPGDRDRDRRMVPLVLRFTSFPPLLSS